LAIWNSFSFKIWQIWIFFPWKFLCIGQNCIIQVKIWWNFTNKRITPWQEDLAKFGFGSKRKLEKFRNDVIFRQHATTYCLNLVTSSFFPPHNVATVGQSPPTHPPKQTFVHVSRALFISLSRLQNFAPKKNLWV
jgi:hypothetical protein